MPRALIFTLEKNCYKSLKKCVKTILTLLVKLYGKYIQQVHLIYLVPI